MLHPIAVPTELAQRNVWLGTHDRYHMIKRGVDWRRSIRKAQLQWSGLKGKFYIYLDNEATRPAAVCPPPADR